MPPKEELYGARWNRSSFQGFAITNKAIFRYYLCKEMGNNPLKIT